MPFSFNSSPMLRSVDGQRSRVRDANVHFAMIEAGAAGGQVDVIVARQSVLKFPGLACVLERRRSISPGKHGRQIGIRRVAGWTQLIRGSVVRGGLAG